MFMVLVALPTRLQVIARCSELVPRVSVRCAETRKGMTMVMLVKRMIWLSDIVLVVMLVMLVMMMMMRMMMMMMRVIVIVVSLGDDKHVQRQRQCYLQFADAEIQ
jgi:hypothetical protein